jgi:hypothetical protein
VALGALNFKSLVNVVQSLLFHMIVLRHEGITASLVLLGVEFGRSQQEGVASFANDSGNQIGHKGDQSCILDELGRRDLHRVWIVLK